MASSYIAILAFPEDRGLAWNASFPDIPGCVSTGRNFEDAMNNAWEALALHVEGLRTFGQRLPPSRSFADLFAGHICERACIPAQIDVA